MESAISIKDIADLLFSARERIDFYWNFHVAVVIALLGWHLSLKKTLTPTMKSLVSFVFIIAAVMNLAGLYSAYTLAEALRTDLLRMTPETLLTETRPLLAQHSYLTQRTFAIWTHLVIGSTVLLVVWLARFSEQPEPRVR